MACVLPPLPPCGQLRSLLGREVRAVWQEPCSLSLEIGMTRISRPSPPALSHFCCCSHGSLSGLPFWKPKTGVMPSLSPPMGCIYPVNALRPLSFPGNQCSATSPSLHPAARLSLPVSFPKLRCCVCAWLRSARLSQDPVSVSFPEQ